MSSVATRITNACPPPMTMSGHIDPGDPAAVTYASSARPTTATQAAAVTPRQRALRSVNRFSALATVQP